MAYQPICNETQAAAIAGVLSARLSAAAILRYKEGKQEDREMFLYNMGEDPNITMRELALDRKSLEAQLAEVEAVAQ
eukprot:10745294-Karenia_brevis.AAC.1